MIILYDKNKIDGFDRNDLVLQNVTKCEVTWERNGQYQIDLIYPVIPGDTNWQKIVKGAIIKCPVPYQQDQLFRLNTPSKTLDSSGFLFIEAIGMHITYDLAYNLLEGINIANDTGQDAGPTILANTQYDHNFVWNTDTILDDGKDHQISSVNEAYYIRQNVIDALIGTSDQAFINRWGGELTRDNFTIGMLNGAGINRGAVIKYSKNLIGFEQSADDSQLVTRAMPTIPDNSDLAVASLSVMASDPVTISPVKTLPEKYVDSPLIKDYANIFIKEVPVTLTDAQLILPIDKQYQLMRDYVNSQYANSHIDLPIYSYTINFVELSKTEEYKDYAILEEVHPMDLIVVKALDVDVVAELVGHTYDSITKKYLTFTLGNVKNDFIRGNQKSLFNVSTQNAKNIQILQQQMNLVPAIIDSSSSSSGGVNLFENSLLIPLTSVKEGDPLTEAGWDATGATVVEDTTLQATNEVWNMPPASTVSKNNIISNPNSFNGQDMTFSLWTKYNGITVNVDDDVTVQTSNTLLGQLGISYKRCIAINGSGWVFNDAQTGIISADYIPMDISAGFTVINPSNYPIVMTAYDNNNVVISTFTETTMPENIFSMKIEIIQAGLTPDNMTEFSIFETAEQTIDNLSSIYANSTDSEWEMVETGFTLETSNSNDVITAVNFNAHNGDTAGTASIGAFMISTGTGSSDYSQSNNDTIAIFKAHQTAIDNATKLITGANGGHVILHTNGAGQIYEILIMDTEDIITAQNVWRWDLGGFGYSSTGYNGPYETAITMDGSIVASFISGLEIVADIIKGGTLTLGGLDNISGSCIIKDAAGNIVMTLDNTGILVNQASYRVVEDNGTQIVVGSKENLILDSSFENLLPQVGSWSSTYYDNTFVATANWVPTSGLPRMVASPYGVVSGTYAVATTASDTAYGGTNSYTVNPGLIYTMSAFVTPHFFRNVVGASINYAMDIEFHNSSGALISTVTTTGNITTSFKAFVAGGLNLNPVLRITKTVTAPPTSCYVSIKLYSASASQWIVWDALQLVAGNYPSAYIPDNVAEVNYLQGLNNGCIGQIAFFAMNATPTGWINCFGQTISRTIYANLFAAIGTIYGVGDGSTTFQLPDMRNNFARGYAQGVGIDSTRVFGSYEDDSVMTHAHYFSSNYIDHATTTGGTNRFAACTGGGATPGGVATGVQINGNPNVNETRPRNIAFLCCIKY